MPKIKTKNFSLLEKPPSSLEYMNKQLEHGQTQDNSNASYSLLDTEESLFEKPPKTMKQKQQTKSSKLSIVESQVSSKKTTLKGKSSTCKRTSKDSKCSQTLGRASTSREGDLSPFWNSQCKEWSKRLWSPVEIDSVASRSNISSGSSVALEQNLPSSTRMIHLQNQNCQMMSFPSFKCFAVGEMAKDGTVVRTHRVKLLPNKKQKHVLRSFEEAYRFTYNSVIEYLKNNKRASKFDLRTLFVTQKTSKRTTDEKKKWVGETNPFITANEWLLKVPKAVRQQAVFEAAKNFKQHNNKCNVKTYEKNWTISLENLASIMTNKRIKLSQSRESKQEPIVCHFQGHLHRSLNPDFTEETEITPSCQTQLQRINGSFYLLIPFEVSKHLQPPEFDAKMVGIDPGLRKFLTCYGTDGKLAMIGINNPKKKLMRSLWYRELLDSKLRASKKSSYRVTGKERKAIKKARSKLQERIENIRNDFHHKTASWLTKNYDVLSIGILPKNIISKDKHLPKIVKKAYNTLSHFKFRCCLEEKCVKKGKVFTAINESYTSKTCTLCGCLRNVGSSEVFSCPCSEKKWDRDLNGARNILIKSICESYLRIVVRNDKTLSLGKIPWTKNPCGFSLGLEILKEAQDY